MVNNFDGNDNEVLLIGAGGGRGHALGWEFKQSPLVRHVFVTKDACPGLAAEKKVTVLPFGSSETYELIRFALRRRHLLALVGPEAPLGAGVANAFNEMEIPIFGPTLRAALLEWSKCYAKDFMNRHGIPTAGHLSFWGYPAAEQHLLMRATQGRFPVVIKEDGFAGGKGVDIYHSLHDALAGVRRKLKKGGVVIEDFCPGDEVSITYLVSGEQNVGLATARDHKLWVDAGGPMTGGILTNSPAPGLSGEMEERFIREIVKPTIAGLKKDKVPYTGVLYFGGVVTADGPKLYEINTRFGDPEAEVILPRLRGDLFRLIVHLMQGKQPLDADLVWDPRHTACIVVALPGYPGEYQIGKLITGIEKARAVPGVLVFEAGTVLEDNKLYAVGGRVLSVTAFGSNADDAEARAHKAISYIQIEGGMMFRMKGNRGTLAGLPT